MGDWSWKQVVAKCVLDIVNAKNSPTFTLNEVYHYEDEISAAFPRNHNVRQKIRQVLQRLRDDEGFVSFDDKVKAHYTLNLENEELQGEPVLPGQRGIELPVVRRVVRNVRMRCTFLAAELKRRYHCLCQVCRKPVPVSEKRFYAEGHHLKPLGSPHNGPDVFGNIIVLCPNHHVMFDLAVATIVPVTLRIDHRVPDVFRGSRRLHVESWHELDPRYLEYHHRRFLEG